jgi:hypothetical protein
MTPQDAAVQVIGRCTRSGIRVRLSDDGQTVRLRFHPGHGPSEVLLAQVREHKPALIGLLHRWPESPTQIAALPANVVPLYGALAGIEDITAFGIETEPQPPGLPSSGGATAPQPAPSVPLYAIEPGPYGRAVGMLLAGCPKYVDEKCWRRTIADTDAFLERWSEPAYRLGWTARDLLGLGPIPRKIVAGYSRTNRLDQTGLLWMLHGRSVVDLRATEARIQGPTGHCLTWHRFNRPALGPIDDTLDHYGSIA